MNPLLSSTLTAPIETLLNAVLAQDPSTRQQLQPLAGKCVRLECTTVVPCVLYLLIEERQLALRSVYEHIPDASITATAGALSKLATGAQTNALFSPDIALAGDTHLIQALHRIIGALEIDWEAHVASLFGDVLSHQLGQWFSGARQWSREASTSLLQDVEEYLHEEATILPTRSELTHFSARIDEVKLAVDRSQARLQRLLNRLPE